MKEDIYKKYLLTVLMVTLAFNTADQVALELLLQDIKVELELTDTQLGFLTGIAFALFYSVMGIPMARWADHGNRIAILSIATALQCVAVALCGVAGSFVQLLLIRVGVAVGEAGSVPPAHSLLADHFSRAERPRAAGIYMLGKPLSMVIGYFVAGWLNELYGWRVTFMVLGLPGVALAVLAWTTLREPRRDKLMSQTKDTVDSASRPSMKEVFVTLCANTTFRHLLICYSIAALFGYGVWQWKPAFFIRSFGLDTREIGIWFAAIYGSGGLLGTYLGGELASRRVAYNEPLQLKAMGIAYAGFGIISACMYLSSNFYVALALMGLATVGAYTVYGPLFATIQTLVPEGMRATAIAIIYLFANLIGMGFGPLAAGVLSDALRPWAGEDSLRYALLALCPGYLWAGWHLWQASRTVTRDLEATQCAEQQRVVQEGSNPSDAQMRGVLSEGGVNSLAGR